MESNQGPASFRAHRAFAHPAWVGSLLLLLVNDHLLKGAQLLPGWLTGKLSDFAGLFMAPAFFAAALQIGSRRGFFWVHAATGLLFAALKLSPPAARAFEAAMGLLISSRVVVDPTDLLALPALAASFFLLAPLAERGAGLSPLARGSALLMAAFGSVATSAPQPQPTRPAPGTTTFPNVQGSLGLANDTGAQQVIRVRKLKPSVKLECPVVATSPSSFLHPDLFAPAETWLVDGGRVLPLDDKSSASCHALLIDGDGMRAGLVFWQASEFPSRSLPSSTASADAATTIHLRSQGKLASMDSHRAAFPAPGLVAAEIAEECLLPPPEESVEWSEPIPASEQALVAVSPPAAGCVGLDLEKRRVFLCGLKSELPFVAGDKLRFKVTTLGSSEVLSVVRVGDGAQVLLGRGDAEPFSLINELPPTSASPVGGCLGQRIECGGLARPAQVSFGETTLRGGEVLETTLGPIHILQAKYLPVFDAECTSARSTAGVYIEWSAVLSNP